MLHVNNTDRALMNKKRKSYGGRMKKENTAEAVSCWNLERILDAEQSGQPMHEELTLDDLLREDMMCSK